MQQRVGIFLAAIIMYEMFQLPCTLDCDVVVGLLCTVLLVLCKL